VLIAGLASSSTSAEPTKWGFAVYDAKGEFVASRWPEGDRFDLGSGDDSIVPLAGLDRKQATFVRKDDEIAVVPFGPVEINGKRIHKRTTFKAEDKVKVGEYELTFFAPGYEPEEGPFLSQDGEDEEPASPPYVPPGTESPAPTPIDRAAAESKLISSRKPEFKNGGYRFCHDPQYGKGGTDGTEFCSIFDETSEAVCPEAKKRCPDWKSSTPKLEGPDRELNFPRLSIPAPIAWIAIIIAVGFALAWFLKSLLGAGWESEEGGLETGDLTAAEANLQALPDARSQALLKLAHKAIERGDAKEAAILVHLAVLRFLDDEGLARYHPSKTNGDYLRAIRKHKPLALLFRTIANETERIRFGDGNVDAVVVKAQLESAGDVLVRSTSHEMEAHDGSLGAAATTMIIGALLTTQLSCASCGERLDPAYHSQRPSGMSALPSLLRQAGFAVDISRAKLSAVPTDAGAVVMRTSAGDEKWPSDLKLDALLDRGLEVVIIDDVGKAGFFVPATSSASLSRDAAHLARARSHGGACSSRIGEAVSRSAGDAVLPRGPTLTWDLARPSGAVAASVKEVYVESLFEYKSGRRTRGVGSAFAVAGNRIEAGKELAGCLYVFAGRDLFTNASLTRESNARLVAELFADLVPDGRKVVFIDRLDHWVVDDNDTSDKESSAAPTKPLSASHMLPFLIQAGLALIALYIALGAAFGPLRDPAVSEHKAFIEHVEALGRQYARTGLMGLTHSARSLARLIVMRYRDRVRGGTTGGWSAVAHHLAQKLDLEEKNVKAALRLGIDGVSELGAPGADDPTPASDEMLRTLTRLLGGREEAVGRRASQRGTRRR
jgi:hypothetical protein